MEAAEDDLTVVQSGLKALSRTGFIAAGHFVLFNRRAFGIGGPPRTRAEKTDQTVWSIVGLGGGTALTIGVAAAAGLGDATANILTAVGGGVLLLGEIIRIQSADVSE